MTACVSEVGEGGAVIAVVGDLDIYTAPNVTRELRAVVESGRAYVVMNLESVTYIDSTGIGALLDGARRAHALGGAVSIVTHDPWMINLLRCLRLTKTFPLHPDLPSARAELESHLRAPAATP